MEYKVGKTVSFYEYGHTGLLLKGVIQSVLDEKTVEVLVNKEVWIVGMKSIIKGVV